MDVACGKNLTYFVKGDGLVGVGGSDEDILPPTEWVAGIGQTVFDTELIDCVGNLNLTIKIGDGELVTVTEGSGESRDLVEVHGGYGIDSIHLMFNY